MARPKKDYRVQLKDRRGGRERYELLVDNQRYLLQAETKAEAEAEGAERYRELQARRAAPAMPGPDQPAVTPRRGTLRAAVTAYMRSDKWRTFKPLSHLAQTSTFNIVMRQPAPPPSRNVLGDSLLSYWLGQPHGSELVRLVMAECGTQRHAANKRLIHLRTLFKWLLSKTPDAAKAREELGVSVSSAINPCIGVDKPEPTRDGKRHGHLAFADDDIEEWLRASKDDAEQNRAIRWMQILGPRVSDLHRLNRFMIKATPYGKVLTYKQVKGSGSMYRAGEPPEIVVPWVPELQALLDELPADRTHFLQSKWGQPFKSARSMSNKVRSWRKECGLPEGLSAHGMRKSATHWWLANYADLIGNNFSLKAIFGWVTDKELERYTRDFNRKRTAEGMLIKLSERRPARKAE
jgi:integrase